MNYHDLAKKYLLDIKYLENEVKYNILPLYYFRKNTENRMCEHMFLEKYVTEEIIENALKSARDTYHRYYEKSHVLEMEIISLFRKDLTENS